MNVPRRIGRVVLAAVALAVVAYVMWGRVERTGLSRDIAEIRDRGEPVDLVSWQQNPKTEEQRRAARLYAEAGERVQEIGNQDNYRFVSVDVDRAGSPVPDLAELEATYRHDEPALQLLDQATPLDFAGFGSTAPDFDANQMHLATLGALNALRADLLAKRGEADAAVAALVASVRLQRTIAMSGYRHQPMTRMLGDLRILLRHTAPTAEALLRLQRAFDELPDEDGLASDVMQLRARFIDALDEPGGSLPESMISWVFRPLTLHYGRRQLRAFDETLAIARQPWPGKLAAASAMEARYRDPAQWNNAGTLRRLIERGPPALAIMSLNITAAGVDVASRRTAVTVLALERYRRAHGSSPASGLDELVPAFLRAVPPDPFTGKPLIYRRQADGYIVYSVDMNRADDGGQLYGFGATVTPRPRGSASSRDLGIQVPLMPRN